VYNGDELPPKTMGAIFLNKYGPYRSQYEYSDSLIMEWVTIDTSVRFFLSKTNGNTINGVSYLSLHDFKRNTKFEYKDIF
ncbi:hypothetical protein KKI24_22675, partial [bacterium]|nr:hypothetical protein [bacterium]